MITGIHHITALASDPQRNLDFYVDVLGLRLVKRTVNFDAPDVYHLYYGDEIGQPGTILTFFPFQDAVRGKHGVGEISSVAFRVPKDSLEFWVERLSRYGIHVDGPFRRFDDELIAFQDPDGMVVELVFSDSRSVYRHWSGSSIPAEFAIRRFHGATLQLGSRKETDDVFQKTLMFRFAGQNGNRFRYLIGHNESEAAIDLLIDPKLPHARQSAGSVHHIAWRVADGASQQQWRERLIGGGMHPTEILDRQYFQSVYFREPGGVLFEIATDSPGFAVDEQVEKLGAQLKLPPWLEPERLKLERMLPPIELRKTLIAQ
jgi:glyoxalase family protein